MSKIGKKQINIPEGVVLDIKESDKMIDIKGPLGELKIKMLNGVYVSKDNNVIALSIKDTKKQIRSNWGTLRSLLANAVVGVTSGFEKKLILEGIGCRINKEGNDLLMTLGFSHPVRFKAPEGIFFEVEKTSILKLKGIDKALVGKTAAEIRALKKPEPYKGTGFRYENEVIKRKAGKRTASA